MNLKVISRNIGYALLVSALFMFLSMLVSLLDGGDSALAPLSISFLITFIVGIFPFIFVRKTPAISLREGYLIIVLSWILSFIFGMLPYALWGGPFTLENAFFESVSGFTTSGATILEDIEALPKSLLFWRSATHFIGGLGVVVFLLLVIPASSPMRLRLTTMELSSLSKEGYNSRANKTVSIFAYIYIGIMLLAFVSYMLAGMSPFDAICHAFSVCATGGFSTRNLSIGAFNSRLIEGLTMLFMLLSSIHFGLLFMVIARRSLRPLNNPVLKFYLGALVAAILVVAVSLRSTGVAPAGKALWYSAFHVMCITTTTGFAIFDNAAWPAFPTLIVLLMGIMCGCAGSTSGGVKADRVLISIKAIGRQLNRVLHPSAVSEVRLGKHYLKDEDIYPHILYISVYSMLLIISIGLSLVIGMDSTEAFSGSVASMGNLGPATGRLGTYGNYNCIPEAAKYLFCLDMFLGRVEIYPVLAVVAMMFTRRRK
ncbi:MAG: TrkH family potassium uptake protein [Bacteroidales bacterium]|nr:TrkH family potassium uptake protein [Bacteroidales bacterium]